MHSGPDDLDYDYLAKLGYQTESINAKQLLKVCLWMFVFVLFSMGLIRILYVVFIPGEAAHVSATEIEDTNMVKTNIPFVPGKEFIKEKDELRAKNLAIPPAATAGPVEGTPELLPHLQEDPIGDMRKFRKAENERLQGYGWVDKDKGVGHMPVDKAMDEILKRGLPSRAQK